ncbi:MAG: hypothetical protein RR243_01235 [Citrobacter sp.]
MAKSHSVAWRFIRRRLFRPAKRNAPLSISTPGDFERNYQLRRNTIISIGIGVFAIILFATSHSPEYGFLSRVGAGLALGFGCLVAGSLLGFVFGIPRTLQHDVPASQVEAGVDKEAVKYQINTNLEQISDWLTKIIIGVGLIEMRNIGSWLVAFSKEIGLGFGTSTIGQAFVFGILVYYLAAGFLLGYLWTRLSFGLAIRDADQGLVERRLNKFEAEVRADSTAVALVTRQLTQGHGDPGPSQEELDKAIASASRHSRVRVFYDAVRARQNVEQCEKSIPVFRALINCDKAGAYHRNHGQLAFALKDKHNPDWAKAEEELSTAISIRDRTGDTRFREYEFNRAVCRIRLGRPNEDIIADLKSAGREEWLREWRLSDNESRDWLKKNNVHLTDFGFESD